MKIIEKITARVWDFAFAFGMFGAVSREAVETLVGLIARNNANQFPALEAVSLLHGDKRVESITTEELEKYSTLTLLIAAMVETYPDREDESETPELIGTLTDMPDETETASEIEGKEPTPQ